MKKRMILIYVALLLLALNPLLFSNEKKSDNSDDLKSAETKIDEKIGLLYHAWNKNGQIKKLENINTFGADQLGGI